MEAKSFRKKSWKNHCCMSDVHEQKYVILHRKLQSVSVFIWSTVSSLNWDQMKIWSGTCGRSHSVFMCGFVCTQLSHQADGRAAHRMEICLMRPEEREGQRVRITSRLNISTEILGSNVANIHLHQVPFSKIRYLMVLRRSGEGKRTYLTENQNSASPNNIEICFFMIYWQSASIVCPPCKADK